MFSVVARRSGGHYKAAARFIQGSQYSSLIMGSSYSKSYSVNDFIPQTLQNRQSTTDEACRGTICKMQSPEDYIESEVCSVDDLKDNEMKVFEMGTEGKVLLIKQNGEFSAIGTDCTHYGAPLVTGALGAGRVRCPWHGACFNIKTGDIEDFPGFDSLPCYQVSVTDKGNVKVRAKKTDLQTKKRIKEIQPMCPSSGPGVVVIGGGPSGATCAETLRSEGYKGSITLVAKEPYLPYDRIKVSKIGTVTDIKKLQARTSEYYQNNRIDIFTSVEATKVDTAEKVVHLSNNNKIPYSALYIATGCQPRVPDIPGINLKNIFTVRDFSDAMNIIGAIGEDKDKDVVVLGLGFIGLEVASSCLNRAKSMTVVGTDSSPLGRVFGEDIGVRLKQLFEEKGVKFEFNNTITECRGEGGVIKSVVLEGERVIPADVLILGVGTTFYTKFLKDSGIAMLPNGAVDVNTRLETSVSGVYAGGDIAYAPIFAADGKQMNIGHIGLAQYHGRVAALNILKKETLLHTVPFFWTMLFGKSIRYAGCGIPHSREIVGDLAEMKFVVFFFDQQEKVIAVASCGRDPVVAQFAELLRLGKPLYKKDLKNDPFAWTSQISSASA